MSNKLQLVQDTTEFRSLMVQDFKKVLKEASQVVPQKEIDKLLSRKDTSEYLGVDLSTLHNWNKSGKLTPYGIGNRVFYKMSDIEKALIPLNKKG
jgi:hypothetical protein